MCEGRTKAGLEGVELLQLDVVELESKCVECRPKPDVDPPPMKKIVNKILLQKSSHMFGKENFSKLKSNPDSYEWQVVSWTFSCRVA